jgi:hypothetical protein
MAQVVCHRLLIATVQINPGQFMVDLRRTERYGDRLFSEFFVFPPSASSHQFSMLFPSSKTDVM